MRQPVSVQEPLLVPAWQLPEAEPELPPELPVQQPVSVQELQQEQEQQALQPRPWLRPLLPEPLLPADLPAWAAYSSSPPELLPEVEAAVPHEARSGL